MVVVGKVVVMLVLLVAVIVDAGVEVATDDGGLVNILGPAKTSCS